MADLPYIVFDVNETLLDLETLQPTFERIFGDKLAMRLWFVNLILYSAALTVANSYVSFTDIGAAVMKMLADVRGVKVSEADRKELIEKFSTMPPHSDREAGSADAPVLLLLHGFPTSSHMFRDLIPLLADRLRLVAPDLPGFGRSDMPERSEFAYTFDHVAGIMDRFTDAIGLMRFAIYVFDYGAPTGFRIAAKRPERITAIISQNGNAYEEGLSDGWNPIRAYWQYTHGAPDLAMVSPDGYSLDNYYLARPGVDEAQLDLFGDYKSNVALYPTFQAYFRPTSHAFWRFGGRTIRSSCQRAQRRSNGTSQTGSSAFWTLAISHWRPTQRRSHPPSATFFPADSRAVEKDFKQNGQSEEIGELMAFSVSRRARFMTGSTPQGRRGVKSIVVIRK